MIPKCWKHDPLPPMVQMKETVPREDAMKSLRETKLPHIRHHRTLTHESMRSHLTKQNAATYRRMARQLLKVVPAKELPMEAEKFVRILDAMTTGLLFTYFQTPELMTEDIIITAFEALA